MRRRSRVLALAAIVVALPFGVAARSSAHAAMYRGKLLVGHPLLGPTLGGCSWDSTCLPGYRGQSLTFIKVGHHGGDAFTLVTSKPGLLGSADFDVCFLDGSERKILPCAQNHVGPGSESGTIPLNAAEARVELFYGADAEFTLTTS